MNSPFYRKFSIDEFGVNAEQFLRHIRPVYETLEWDYYDTARGGLNRPTRKRAVAETILENRGEVWSVAQVKARPYIQESNHQSYDRTTPRVYPEPPLGIVEHPEFIKLQQGLAKLISSVRRDAKKLRLILTFLRTVDEERRTGICALEGEPHSDGMEYIVSAMVVNRRNLKEGTGVSSVYSLDGSKLHESVLGVGEGIFQDDRLLLHHISNIKRDDPNQSGIRDMLGVDFVVNPE